MLMNVVTSRVVFKMSEYKAGWYENEIHRVSSMYPRSQIGSFYSCRNLLVKIRTFVSENIQSVMWCVMQPMTGIRVQASNNLKTSALAVGVSKTIEYEKSYVSRETLCKKSYKS